MSNNWADWFYVDGHQRVADTFDPETVAVVGPVGDNNPANGQHGWCHSNTSVQQLTLYWDNGQCSGVEVDFYDAGSHFSGDSPNSPNSRDNGSTLTLNRGEKVTYLEMRTRGDNFITMVHFKTDQGQDVTLGDSGSNGPQTVFTGDRLGTGILVGVFGHTGSLFNSLGFIFSLQETGETLTNFTWYPQNAIMLSQNVIALQDISVVNSSNSPQSVNMDLSVSITVQTGWSSTSGVTFTQSLTITAQLPVVSVSGSVSFAENTTTTKSTDTSRTVVYTTQASVTTQPRTEQKAHAEITETKMNIPWQATWTKSYSDGTSSNQVITGLYTGVSYQGYNVVYDPSSPLPSSMPLVNGVSSSSEAVSPLVVDGKVVTTDSSGNQSMAVVKAMKK